MFMPVIASKWEDLRTWSRTLTVPTVVTTLAFAVLFWQPIATLVRDWWSDPDAAHGLLLFPVAVYLGIKTPRVESRPQAVLGLAALGAAVLLRYVSGLAAELFTMRASLIAASAGLVLFHRGWGQLRAWWLPAILISLSVPLPAVVLNSLALPLQLKASEAGAALLHARNVPVQLAGNVLHLPDRTLFVTEACSGLRSLTALFALGILTGGLWLQTVWARTALAVAAIPVAMVVNAVRVFITGFLVYYVNPALADGFSHYTEGWVLFVVAFGILGGLAWVLGKLERRGGAQLPVPPVTGTHAPSLPFSPALNWGPTALFAVGIVLTVGLGAAGRHPLRMPLASAIPGQMSGMAGVDATISEEESRAAGFTNYLLRSYAPARDAEMVLSLYVGYYDSQTQGKTIHSPKNCLPGSGWEALQSGTTTVETAEGPVTVNRYLIKKGQQQALVLYWYQGRGRIQANEYAVKWNLLRDAALRRRSEEALVRIVVPMTAGVDEALTAARGAAQQLMGDLNRALPG